MIEREIFSELLQLTTEANRCQFLNEVCGNDLRLRQRVESLVQVQATLGDFMERPVAETIVTTSGDDTQRRSDRYGHDTGATGDVASVSLTFLEPPDREGTLGRLAHYEMTEVAGHGGMSIVFKARDLRLNRVVAVKVLAPELAANATARTRFLREAQAAAAISHDHVVTIHAVEDIAGEDSSHLPYLVMEFIEGKSLQEKINGQGPLGLNELLCIGREVAAGLAAAHQQGLVHRDVKPSNILLQNGVERVQITDFGLACAADDAGITQAGLVPGTPQYMSPEQAQGRRVDARSDLFSLGSVLYAMCTGRSPFRSATTVAALRRVCDDTPEPIRKVNPDIPEWLVAVIDRLLRKDPEERFQTATEVSDLLGRCLAHVQDPALTPLPDCLQLPPPRRVIPRLWLTVAAILLTATAGLAITEATGLTGILAGTLFVRTGMKASDVKDRPGSARGGSDTDSEPLREPAWGLAAAGPFVLRQVDGSLRTFDSLAAAVGDSHSGATIEIHGNGPFVSDGVFVRHALTIRAGSGFHPIIRQNLEAEAEGRPLLSSSALLVVEGITLQRWPNSGAARWGEILVSNYPGELYVANCRLLNVRGVCLTANGDVTCRNCEILVPPGDGAAHRGDGPAVRWSESTVQRTVIANCIINRYLEVTRQSVDDFHLNLELDGNTLFDQCVRFELGPIPLQALLDGRQEPMVRIQAHRNVWGDRRTIVYVGHHSPTALTHTSAEVGEAVRRLLLWQESFNLYPTNWDLFQWISAESPDSWQFVSNDVGADLQTWTQFWQLASTGSVQGNARFVGGNVMQKIATDPEHLTPAEFRLAADSPGYRAGPDGHDLGADVDLVGPGEAYDRWKQTPEYDQWVVEIETTTHRRSVDGQDQDPR